MRVHRFTNPPNQIHIKMTLEKNENNINKFPMMLFISLSFVTRIVPYKIINANNISINVIKYLNHIYLQMRLFQEIHKTMLEPITEYLSTINK